MVARPVKIGAKADFEKGRMLMNQELDNMMNGR